MTAKEVIKFALAGYKTPAEIKKLSDAEITAEEVSQLKEAGYSKDDVFKLLELVETSPAIQEAAPKKLEDAKHIKENPTVLEDVPDIKVTQENEDERKQILENLFKEG